MFTAILRIKSVFCEYVYCIKSIFEFAKSVMVAGVGCIVIVIVNCVIYWAFCFNFGGAILLN